MRRCTKVLVRIISALIVDLFADTVGTSNLLKAVQYTRSSDFNQNKMVLVNISRKLYWYCVIELRHKLYVATLHVYLPRAENILNAHRIQIVNPLMSLGKVVNCFEITPTAFFSGKLSSAHTHIFACLVRVEAGKCRLYVLQRMSRKCPQHIFQEYLFKVCAFFCGSSMISIAFFCGGKLFFYTHR